MDPVLTGDEFRRITDGAEDPMLAAIQYALGAASTSWDPMPGGVFQSQRVAQIARDLAAHLRHDYALMPNEHAAHLLVVLDHAVPNPAIPGMNWEGKGRTYARAMLTDALDGRATVSPAPAPSP
jgi:hypothetical protein